MEGRPKAALTSYTAALPKTWYYVDEADSKAFSSELTMAQYLETESTLHVMLRVYMRDEALSGRVHSLVGSVELRKMLDQVMLWSGYRCYDDSWDINARGPQAGVEQHRSRSKAGFLFRHYHTSEAVRANSWGLYGEVRF